MSAPRAAFMPLPQLSLGSGIGRRYALSFSALAIGLSLAAGGLNAVSAYRQARDGAYGVLTARAEMAALAVEGFFGGIEDTLVWASHASVLSEADARSERRSAFMRAVQRHPAVTEAYHLDASGRETLRISQRRLDGARSEGARGASFRGAAPLAYSDVFFQYGSEPYVIMRLRDEAAQTAAVYAEINLRAVWDAIRRIKIGETGYAYILDDRGELVSHSDSRLALARLDFSNSDQFRRAVSGVRQGGASATSLAGGRVAYALAPVPGLGWTVFAELPSDEAYAPFYRSLRQGLAMLALAMVAACAASMLLAQHMAGPIRNLHAGARRFAGGRFATAIPVAGDDEIAGLATSLNDMAALIQAREQDLRDSRERYALASDGARDGLWDWDLRRGGIYFSRRWRSMVGETGEARIGRLRDWITRVDRRDRSALAKAFRAHLDGETSHMRCEYRVATPEGVRWMLARGVAVRDGAGRAVRMAGSQTNITEIRAAFEQLAAHRDELERLVSARTAQATQMRNRLADAIDSADDGIAIFEGDGSPVQSNERFAEFRQLASAGSLDSTSLGAVAEGLGGACQIKLETLQARGEAFVEEFGPIAGRWYEMRGQSMASGGFLLRVADVTTYREAQAALVSSLEKQRDLARAHRTFVAMTSHQFRTPLAIIDSAAQRLARRKLRIDAVEIEERASQIRSVVRRITELTERTLSLSMLDAGTLDFKPRRDDLRTLVENAVAAQRVIAPQHRIDIDFSEDEASGFYDPTLIEQVIANLLANAVKFTPEGRAVRVRLEGDHGGTRVAVVDEGIGIPADELSSIFDRFFRARNTSGIAGSGLGLTLCSEIIRLHGGVLAAVSREGEGSTFSFTLPRRPASSAREAIQCP
jgi:PAS domain S-box-containing protein